MATKVRVSKQGKLYGGDWLRGLYMAVASPVLYFVLEWLDKENEPFSWRTILKIALSAGGVYLIKNFGIEPAKTIVTTDTNTKAFNVADRIKKDVV